HPRSESQPPRLKGARCIPELAANLVSRIAPRETRLVHQRAHADAVLDQATNDGGPHRPGRSGNQCSHPVIVHLHSLSGSAEIANGARRGATAPACPFPPPRLSDARGPDNTAFFRSFFRVEILVTRRPWPGSSLARDVPPGEHLAQSG